MALVQIILNGMTISNDPNFTPSGEWGNQSIPMNLHFTDGYYQGYNTTWGGFDQQSPIDFSVNEQYSGYTTNFQAIQNLQVAQASFINATYSGYSTNFGFNNENEVRSVSNVAKNTIIDHPKDQTIYYKLKGYNPNTQSYESWIISENITGQPELFDPGRNPPNFESDVYFTPPSLNNLVNIIIVARWIQ